MRVREIADILGGELLGDPELDILGVAGVEEARKGDVTFAQDRKNLELALQGDASCIILTEPEPGVRKAQIKVPNPLYAFAVMLGHFHKPDHGPEGVSDRAFLAKGVSLGEGVSVHPMAYVSEGASIGRGTVLYPGVFIGHGASIGEECVLYPNVVVMDGVRVGNRVLLHPGVVLGADGFGYVPHGGRHFKIPQVGGVTLEDDVEIGANTAIDRATTGTTVIGRGTKIDNLVQVGHNVSVGHDAVLVAQVGIGGSTTIGNHVMMGGQAAVSDHGAVDDGTALAARAGVMGHLKKGVYAGAPAMPRRDFFRCTSLFARLPELNKRLSRLEEHLKVTEEGRKHDDGR
jgi:UDP-3-O-[3-hydroxymyristoyl] glucosamine N-acyltransferase